MSAIPSTLPLSSAHARCMVENLTTGVLLFDGAHRLLAINPAAEALLDVSGNQVRGLPVERLFPGTDVEGQPLPEVLRSALPFTQREMRLRLAGGRAVTVDCTVTPLSEPTQPARVLFELVAVDHHRRIEREEHLMAQSQTARSLLRALAHEIRNPLGGLRGAAQLLERELGDHSLREYTRTIMSEADRLRSLLDRMLGPRTPPRMRLVNVHEILERVRALIQAESSSTVTVRRDYDPSIPPLTADPELLIQATLNIARNAVQALGEAGTVTLRTRVRRQATIGGRRHRLAMHIDIMDDGPGVPDALREILFCPLVTGRTDGSGLGLSIAQLLVQQHRGIIECASRPGDTVFRIVLPVEEGA
ncbi:MAG: PAS domain-containing protein [Gammaproteobacteria bacterium]|nr:PAS domain-containing protein [Gammaproteobacteria bacterium]NIR83308.1 PAS domain-containing protein [Gammaproteobacteria bacterium]NIR91108.1 PAS domain-containing protein [Gammaproteobacteria bacterium]NIU04475.1 PAS domain-containing protein [Gammaproteobacteria bacterium]NIW87111.1 PAS domain-containing protein [Gammaproteobacteria bacterium]